MKQTGDPGALADDRLIALGGVRTGDKENLSSIEEGDVGIERAVGAGREGRE
jgi:hypothetical protein